MTWTTYCMKHNELELVGDVTEVKPFVVQRRNPNSLLGSIPTSRTACEVRAHTTAGCRVHFIGGPRWNQ